MVCVFRDEFARPDSTDLGNGWISRGSTPGSPDVHIGVIDHKAAVVARGAKTIVNTDAVRNLGVVPTFVELKVGNWTANPILRLTPILVEGFGVSPYEVSLPEPTKRGTFLFWVSAANDVGAAPPTVTVGGHVIPRYNPGIAIANVAAWQGIGRAPAGYDTVIVTPAAGSTDMMIMIYILAYGYDKDDVNVGGRDWIIAPGGVPFRGTAERLDGPFDGETLMLFYAAGKGPVGIIPPETDPPSPTTALSSLALALAGSRSLIPADFAGPYVIWQAVGDGEVVCGQREQEVEPAGTVAYVFIGSDYGASVMNWTGVTVSIDGNGFMKMWIVRPGGFPSDPAILSEDGDFALVGFRQAEVGGEIDNRTIRLHRTLRPSGFYLYSAVVNGVDYPMWDDGEDLVGTYGLWGTKVGFTLNSTNSGPTPEAQRFESDGCQAPQRQFPRDDGFAMSTRRSLPRPTSTQVGLRRGPTAIT